MVWGNIFSKKRYQIKVTEIILWKPAFAMICASLDSPDISDFLVCCQSASFLFISYSNDYSF